MSDISTKSQELAKSLWAIANDLRGSMDSSKFKNYILGTIFYRYLSERTEKYMDEILKNDGVTYREALENEELEEAVKEMSLDHLGYIIEPDNLFNSIVEKIKGGKFSIEDYEKAIASLVGSTVGQESEAAFDKLFDDMNLQDKDLGKEVSQRTKLISKVINKVYDIDFNFEDAEFDVLGTAYMILIGLFASDAGKKGGEFFTPQEVSKLLALIAIDGRETINRAYDPACGSGSLLLQFRKLMGDNVKNFYGQEINITTYNLCRINMFLHGVNFEKFDIALGDTLIDPQHWYYEPFDAIVSNPPYSTKWVGDGDATLINDPRFSPAGVLAPKSKADLAFTMHMLSWLSTTGTAAIVEFPGVLYRGGAEGKIRKYLIENNYVDTVIQLPDNLFFGVSIATCIIVLKKSKGDNCVLFVDASNEFVHEGNKNKLSEDNIKRIKEAVFARKEEQHFTRLVKNTDIAEKDYNLSVSSYVEKEDTREVIDIVKLNAEIERIVAHENELRMAINKIINELR